jgi:tetratricopeptide (TPR) repeat protein
VNLQPPTSNIQRRSNIQYPNNYWSFVRAWRLDLLWILDVGCWMFFWLLLLTFSLSANAATSDSAFIAGADAYSAGDFERAAEDFRQSAKLRPASGTLQNLGLAEWQRGKTGYAILAWEQALWLDPFNQSARTNLRFARKAAQLEAPELSWDQVVSSWLPVNWWAWIAGLSLWLAVGMSTLPGVLRLPKAGWHQALAAFGVMLFLLSVPAHLGVYTRSKMGFVLEKDTQLRLTPTAEAQALTQLAPGEPARLVRARGNYVLVRTSRASGWIDRAQFGLICPRSGKI